MGQSVSAVCTCGFSDALDLGAGMRDYMVKGVAKVIAYNPDKPEFLNITEAEAQKRRLKFICNSSLNYQASYICPACSNKDLKFKVMILWD